jgi:hypothetical protein
MIEKVFFGKQVSLIDADLFCRRYGLALKVIDWQVVGVKMQGRVWR